MSFAIATRVGEPAGWLAGGVKRAGQPTGQRRTMKDILDKLDERRASARGGGGPRAAVWAEDPGCAGTEAASEQNL